MGLLVCLFPNKIWHMWFLTLFIQVGLYSRLALGIVAWQAGDLYVGIAGVAVVSLYALYGARGAASMVMQSVEYRGEAFFRMYASEILISPWGWIPLLLPPIWDKTLLRAVDHRTQDGFWYEYKELTFTVLVDLAGLTGLVYLRIVDDTIVSPGLSIVVILTSVVLVIPRILRWVFTAVGLMQTNVVCCTVCTAKRCPWCVITLPGADKMFGLATVGKDMDLDVETGPLKVYPFGDIVLDDVKNDPDKRKADKETFRLAKPTANHEDFPQFESYKVFETLAVARGNTAAAAASAAFEEYITPQDFSGDEDAAVDPNNIGDMKATFAPMAMGHVGTAGSVAAESYAHRTGSIATAASLAREELEAAPHPFSPTAASSGLVMSPSGVGLLGMQSPQ